jgi:DNA-binding GntR family transcriptional regulator
VFNEREEAAKLGMSRTPFRQALHRLGLEGLVVPVPKRGVFVSLVSVAEIRSHMVVRLALETEVVRQILTHHLPVPLAELDDLTEQMRRAGNRGDMRRFLELDEAFHIAIVQAAENPPALEAVRRSWIHLNRVRYLDPVKRPGVEAAIAEHQRLQAALAGDDVDTAVTAVRAHLEQSLARLTYITRRIPSAFLDPDEPDGSYAVDAAALT